MGLKKESKLYKKKFNWKIAIKKIKIEIKNKFYIWFEWWNWKEKLI